MKTNRTAARPQNALARLPLLLAVFAGLALAAPPALGQQMSDGMMDEGDGMDDGMEDSMMEDDDDDGSAWPYVVGGIVVAAIIAGVVVLVARGRRDR